MRLDIFAHATGCTVRTTGKKRMLLMHTAGKEVQGIFATLVDTRATYDAALNAHFFFFFVESERYFSETCFLLRLSES